jgi:hypothetical protein
MPCVVYWLFDDRCFCPWRHGYIGISIQFDARLKRHRDRAGTRKSAVGVPSIFDHKIIFTGTVDECVALEAAMRPRKNIGWNRAVGGREPWLNYKHDAGIRSKLSAAASNRKRKRYSSQPLVEPGEAAELLDYDPDTGVFRWRVRRRGRPYGWMPAGTPAGSVWNDGYRYICINGTPYRADQLAFVLMTREWPQRGVDHNNKNRADDRWLNLMRN